MIAILLPLVLQTGPGWWNGDWSCRRPLEVRNHLDGALPAGHPVSVRLDPGFLGLDERARPDLADLVVVHSGKRILSAVMPGRKPGTFVLWFPTAEPIGEGKRDAAYFVYYGNAAPPPAPSAPPFGIFEDFGRATAVPKFLEPAPQLRLVVGEGVLQLHDGAPSRSPEAPARVTLRVPPPPAGFALSLDLLVENPGVGTEVAANVDLKAPGTEDPSLVPRARKLIGRLNHPNWEIRENATRDLIRIGPAAAGELEKAVASKDPEVRWRAGHCLKMIRENAPPPVIRAGVRIGDPDAPPVTLPFAIGKLRGRQRHTPEEEVVRMRLDLQRDPDGDVTLLWNGSRAQSGHLPGPVERISLTFSHAGGDPPPSVRIRTLVLRACVDGESRPTTVLEPEQSRP